MGNRGKGYAEAVTEFHIVGGLHPELSLDWFCQMISGLKERYPAVHLKAFTMVEVAYLAKRGKISILDTLVRLKEAGVDSMPGGGAEVFSERVRRIICDHKIDGNEWLETARLAHQIGLKSNCTMLYGHLETPEDRADHLSAAAFRPGRNERFRHLHSIGVSSGEHGAQSSCDDYGVQRH